MRRVAKLTFYAKQSPLWSHLHIVTKPDTGELYSCTCGTKPLTSPAWQHPQTHKAYKHLGHIISE